MKHVDALSMFAINNLKNVCSSNKSIEIHDICILYTEEIERNIVVAHCICAIKYGRIQRKIDDSTQK